MPNLQNAMKQLRKDKKRTIANLKIKADLKTLIKKARKGIAAKEKGIDELLTQIQKSAGKAVQKNIMKKNTAARMLSNLYALKKKITVK
jgi:ribosomal protein S20